MSSMQPEQATDHDLGFTAEPRVLYLIKRVELAVRTRLDRITRQHGLTALQYTALSVLRARPGLSAAQLARRSFVSAQAMSEMVGALEAKGMLEREPDPANRRILRARLTDTGRAALRSCDEDVDALEQTMLVDLDADDVERFRAVLRSCAAALEPRN